MEKIESNQIDTRTQLKEFYKKTIKELHPDLSGFSHFNHDFDQIKKDYRAALLFLENKKKSVPSASTLAQPTLTSRDDFMEEFRELFARGFPINPKLLTKNKAYIASIQKVDQFLAQEFGRKDFFTTANFEIMVLKKDFPKAYWYIQQIIWNIGDFRHTHFDYYRRISVRHLEFIQMTFIENNLGTIWKLLQYIVG